MTRVRSGPGAKPAERPKIIPMVRKFVISNVLPRLARIPLLKGCEIDWPILWIQDRPANDIDLNNASNWLSTVAEPHFRVGFHPKKLLECRMSVNHTIFKSKPLKKNADQTNLGSLRTYHHPRGHYPSGID